MSTPLATLTLDRRPRSLPRALVAQARPKQWVKNLLVVAAPAAGGVLGDRGVPLRVGLALADFCLVASGVYYLNDVLDVEADRRHPTKSRRPIASGEISPILGVGVGIALFVAGAGIGSLLGWRFLLVVGAYVVCTTAYSLRLKHVAVVDLALVASGFVIRAVAGGVAVDVPISEWFLIVTSFGSLFVVAGKRHGEFVEMGEERASTRSALGDYTLGYLRFVWMVSAAVAIAAYCLWAFEQAKAAHPIWHQLSIIPFVLALLRYALLLDQGRGTAPEDILLADRTLQVLAAVWIVIYGIAVYVGPA